jgi:excisionase family DNA binding protein
MEIKKEEYKEFLTEDYLSPKEAAALLGISEADLRELVKKHQIPTHNVAGAFLRLKKKEIEELKIKWRIERELFPTPQKSLARENTLQRFLYPLLGPDRVVVVRDIILTIIPLAYSG